MNRRLYFLFPDRVHALSAVNELAASGVPENDMHALADKDVPLDGLPNATSRQKHDAARRLEKLLWSANLALFCLAFGSCITLLILSGLSLWVLVCIGLMVVTFLAGLRFTHVPNTHLDEFQDALAHGEILLMVDTPESRLADIEDRIHRHHPEAAIGGVGWGTGAFGL
jgi:hypothetical protein